MILSLIIFFLFLFTGFFNSPFWIPCLLFMLFVIICLSVHYLHQEMEEATTKLNVKEALGTVLKRLNGSILCSLVPALLFFFLYAIQLANFGATGDAGDAIVSYFLLGIAFLAYLIYGHFFLKEDISWLLHLILLRRRTRKQPRQVPPVPPLQQQQQV